jgi:hypothetical protein
MRYAQKCIFFQKSACKNQKMQYNTGISNFIVMHFNA